MRTITIELNRIYKASQDGHIYRNGKRLAEHSVNGYLKVKLSIKGKRYHCRVHRLIALAHVPGRSVTRNQVDHIDGDKTNNRADNLRWVTGSENCLAREKRKRLTLQQKNGRKTDGKINSRTK